MGFFLLLGLPLVNFVEFPLVLGFSPVGLTLWSSFATLDRLGVSPFCYWGFSPLFVDTSLVFASTLVSRGVSPVCWGFPPASFAMTFRLQGWGLQPVD